MTKGREIQIGFRETERSSRRSKKKTSESERCSCRVISPSSTMTTCLLNGIEKELNVERVFRAAGRDKYLKKKKCAVCYVSGYL